MTLVSSYSLMTPRLTGLSLIRLKLSVLKSLRAGVCMNIEHNPATHGSGWGIICMTTVDSAIQFNIAAVVNVVKRVEIEYMLFCHSHHSIDN